MEGKEREGGRMNAIFGVYRLYTVTTQVMPLYVAGDVQ